jgi:hypothetical protein
MVMKNIAEHYKLQLLVLPGSYGTEDFPQGELLAVLL